MRVEDAASQIRGCDQRSAELVAELGLGWSQIFSILERVPAGGVQGEGTGGKRVSR